MEPSIRLWEKMKTKLNIRSGEHVRILLGKLLDSKSAAGGAMTTATTFIHSNDAPLLTSSFKTNERVPPTVIGAVLSMLSMSSDVRSGAEQGRGMAFLKMKIEQVRRSLLHDWLFQ